MRHALAAQGSSASQDAAYASGAAKATTVAIATRMDQQQDVIVVPFWISRSLPKRTIQPESQDAKRAARRAAVAQAANGAAFRMQLPNARAERRGAWGRTLRLIPIVRSSPSCSRWGA